MARHRRDAGKEARWRARLERQAASGVSVRAFCRRERVTESAFYFWRRVTAERDEEKVSKTPLARVPETPAAPTSFVPVAVTGPRTGTRGPDASMAIELTGGRVLRLPESISAGRLAELVHAIESRGQR